MIRIMLVCAMLVLSGCVTVVHKTDKVDGGYVPVTENIYAFLNQETASIIVKRSEDSGWLVKGVRDDSIVGDWNIKGSTDVMTITQGEINLNGTIHMLYYTPYSGIFVIVDSTNTYVATMTVQGWLTENAFTATFENGIVSEAFVFVRQDVSND